MTRNQNINTTIKEGQKQLVNKIKELEHQNKELREYKKYAKHESQCDFVTRNPKPCDCGFDKLLNK